MKQYVKEAFIGVDICNTISDGKNIVQHSTLIIWIIRTPVCLNLRLAHSLLDFTRTVISNLQ